VLGSTFINTACNFYRSSRDRDAKLDLRRLAAVVPTKYLKVPGRHSELDLDDPTVSKTSECGLYTFHDAEQNLKIELIDTPGFADTRGDTQDSLNTECIMRMAEKVGELHAMVLVVNGR
jgi:hypothetical protein